MALEALDCILTSGVSTDVPSEVFYEAEHNYFIFILSLKKTILYCPHKEVSAAVWKTIYVSVPDSNMRNK